MAVVGTAGRELIIYQLENRPQEFTRIESPLKFQVHLDLIGNSMNSLFLGGRGDPDLQIML